MFFYSRPFDIINSLPMEHYYGDQVVPEHCVTMCKKGETFSISFSYNISRTLRGFQELELLLNSICRG